VVHGLSIGLVDAKTVAIFITHVHCAQRRNEVRWCPGQEESLAPPCWNLRSFGSKCAVLKKVLVTLLGFFGAP